jgi:hypothetical protein
MAYQKFSERPQGGQKTLGGLAALGGQHPQISGRETVGIPTPTPPKVAKAPKVCALVPAEDVGKSTLTPPKAPKAPRIRGPSFSEAMADPGLLCAQCGGGLSTEPATDAPTIMVYDGKREVWLHPECRRFWFSDHVKDGEIF